MKIQNQEVKVDGIDKIILNTINISFVIIYLCVGNFSVQSQYKTF